MSVNFADGVLAATHKLVQQAMTGQWQEVPKTVEERRVLLDRLSASASPADHSWLSALKQAMAESDAAVAQMATAEGTSDWGLDTGQKDLAPAADEVANVMDMIRGGR
jgi:hypothetical protein